MAILNSFVFDICMWIFDCLAIMQYKLLKLLSPLTEKFAKHVFKKAGIEVNGPNSWDIQVHHPDFYARVATYSSLGLVESYMEGWFDCENITEMFYKIMKSGSYKYTIHINHYLQRHFNLQTKSDALKVGEHHYDTGNDLFEAMLDSEMNYTCGYWKTAKNLDDAQKDKMDLIARKLMLKPGMTVLDIGCGFGGLAKYLAENCGVRVVGLNISKEQTKLAKERCAHLDVVDIRLMDYRDLSEDEKFDRIVSVGMFEHVGHKNYRTYFQVARRCLADDGIFLLHTIGIAHPDVSVSDPFVHKYIFPNGILPRQESITENTKGLFIIEDWHNFGFDYSITLQKWLDNFTRAWPQLEKSYGKKFYRMWTYYLSFACGSFRARKFQLWQIVLTKDGLEGGYRATR